MNDLQKYTVFKIKAIRKKNTINKITTSFKIDTTREYTSYKIKTWKLLFILGAQRNITRQRYGNASRQDFDGGHIMRMKYPATLFFSGRGRCLKRMGHPTATTATIVRRINNKNRYDPYRQG